MRHNWPRPRVFSRVAGFVPRIDALETKVATLSASVKGQTIQLSAQGVTSCTLYLDAKLIDLNAPVRVECDGVVIHEGRVSPSWSALTKSFQGDPHTAAAAELRLELPRVF